MTSEGCAGFQLFLVGFGIDGYALARIGVFVCFDSREDQMLQFHISFMPLLFDCGVSSNGIACL